VKSQHNDQRVFVNVVIKRAKKLRAEKRQEAPLAQQLELTMPGH
jgi:hypothetical protein